MYVCAKPYGFIRAGRLLLFWVEGSIPRGPGLDLMPLLVRFSGPPQTGAMRSCVLHFEITYCFEGQAGNEGRPRSRAMKAWELGYGERKKERKNMALSHVRPVESLSFISCFTSSNSTTRFFFSQKSSRRVTGTVRCRPLPRPLHETAPSCSTGASFRPGRREG